MKYNPDKQGLNKKELKKIKAKYQMLADQVLILLGIDCTFSTKIGEVEKKK